MKKIIIPEDFINKPECYPEELEPGEVKRKFLSLLGAFEKPSVLLNFKVTDESMLEGDIIKQKVEYEVAEEERVSAFHLFHKGLRKNAPGIIMNIGYLDKQVFAVRSFCHYGVTRDNPWQWHISVNNPTDRKITTTLHKTMDLPGLNFPDKTIILNPGEYRVLQ